MEFQPPNECNGANMRIDYSEPKKSYVSGPSSTPKPAKPSYSFPYGVIIVTGLFTFISGFGIGWFFSQKAAKKSFQAAIEQNSLESSQKQVAAQPPPTQPDANQNPQNQTPPQATTPAPQGGTPTGSEQPLSFYKTLPGGQKNNIIGSGINNKDEQGKPIQAPVPANAVKHPQPATTKPQPDKAAANRAKSGGNNFTVQVASYSLKSEAENMKIKLANKGYDVFIVESNLGDRGIFYRVRVGRNLTHEVAKELSAKLGKSSNVVPNM